MLISGAVELGTEGLKEFLFGFVILPWVSSLIFFSHQGTWQVSCEGKMREWQKTGKLNKNSRNKGGPT